MNKKNLYIDFDGVILDTMTLILTEFKKHKFDTYEEEKNFFIQYPWENIINDKYIKLDGLFLLRNSIAPNSIVKDLILEDGYIVVNRNMETNIKGIYACGDCTGNPLQISKATGEGLVAAQNAAKYIDKLKEMI